METISYCPACRAPLPAGAHFCPRCGTTIAQPAAAPASTTLVSPPPARSRTPWWILAMVMAVLLLGGVIWALVIGMPFGHHDDMMQRTESAAPATIPEGSPTSTVSQIGEVPPTTTSAPPPAIVPPPTVTITNSGPGTPPVIVTTPPTTTSNPPMASALPPPPALTETDATNRLRDVLTSSGEVRTDCLSIRTIDARRSNYVLEATDTCSDDVLGRWRVSANGRVTKLEED